ncbi:DMT family transporter [Deminuibacter soli]|uniref:DMT family transporter n=1 Tax=Deminuibacter soli TaxID=2291815 RepID=A0A3E1NDW6_9BACT|nr:DMT family transporter [Deminuibacter soli]RFM26159.1 DMT family transporter [Deminuibacter soli]
MELAEGILFALLWASATAATKLGIRSADPYLLSCLRFTAVGILQLLYVYGIRRGRYTVPAGKQFKQVLILALLNIFLYIGGFVTAVKMVSAGLISLFSATNPLLITLFSAIWLHRKLTRAECIGMAIAFTGLGLAAYPNLRESHATAAGIAILIAGISAISAGSVYYAKIQLPVHRLVVNAWQTFLGGLMFIPLVLLNHNNTYLHADANFYLSIGWLIVPVSIISYGLWLNLLSKDTVKAGMWLFITPMLGYGMAAVVLHEKITAWAIAGTLLVITGLWLSRKRKEVVVKMNG